MAKAIKLQAVVHPDFSKVLVRVVSQTHIGRYFSDAAHAPAVNYWQNPDTRKFVASNGIVLASNEFPARDTDDKNTIWVMGSASAKKNATTIVMTKATFEKVVAAVKEYNATFAAPAPAPAAKPNCGFIVG